MSKKNLQTDIGKELYNADVQKILKKHDVNYHSLFYIFDIENVSDRVINRILKNDMWKMFTLNGNYKWVDELPRQCLISDYYTTRASIALSACDPPT